MILQHLKHVTLADHFLKLVSDATLRIMQLSAGDGAQRNLGDDVQIGNSSLNEDYR